MAVFFGGGISLILWLIGWYLAESIETILSCITNIKQVAHPSFQQTVKSFVFSVR